MKLYGTWVLVFTLYLPDGTTRVYEEKVTPPTAEKCALMKENALMAQQAGGPSPNRQTIECVEK